MIILKIGGSILTKKDSIESEIDEGNLKRIASEIKSSIDNSKKDLVIVHGAGSFGHPPAKKYKIGEPFSKEEYPEKRIGFAKTQNVLPSIVIGRIQNDIKDYTFMSSYKDKYKWI